MTTQPFPRNKVILFAQIDQQRQSRADEKKGKTAEPSIRRIRNVVNGSDYLVGLQVAAPYGGSYQLDVEVGRVEGADLLTQAQAGQVVVLEGHLTRTRDEDERFRDYDAGTIEGIVYQDVHLQVERVRPLTEADPSGTGSNVFLEGEVIEPPYFMRHPDYPEIELARLTIRAHTRPALSDGGLVRPGRPCEVTVIVPTDDEDAGYLYRRGNRVRVRGVIERMGMRQNRTQVTERLRGLEEDWNAQREAIRADEDQEKAARELRYQGNRYVRERERLERGARTMVLAVEVTPLEGAKRMESREEVRQARASYEQELDAARKARNVERRERQRSNRERQQAARERAGEVAGEDAPTDAPPATTPRKPRRAAVAAAEPPVALSEDVAPVVAADDLAPQVEAALAAVSSNGTAEPIEA